MRRSILTLVPVLVLAACVEEPPSEETPTPVPWVEPPVADEVEPVRVAQDADWLIGYLDDVDDDVVRRDLLAGVFEYPDVGLDDLGTRWLERNPDDSGWFGDITAPTWYAVPPIQTRAGERYFAMTQRSSGVFAGPKHQPGYVYGDGRTRVPLLVRSDDDVLAFRAIGRRDFRAQLWQTTDEVHFNFADAQPPDLVQGRATEQWYGVPLLNLSGMHLTPLYAKVVESEWWEATEVVHASIGPDTDTQIAFELIPKQDAPTPPPETPSEEWETVPLTLHVSAPGLEWSYERTVELPTRAEGQAYWRTFRSPVDGSVQRYGVRDPLDFDPGRDYALFLTLHGAGVQGRGQAADVSSKDWAYVVAPTNRHPFGFDWEEWGRFNALASLDHAMEVFNIDPTLVYLGGHSMGGHGTWHVGVTTPGRFATLNPSAGWQSFYTYGGATRPMGSFARARAHSDTINYLDNLARRGVFVVHGDADTNVPFSEGQTMYDLVSQVTDDARFHWEPGAGHWWDGDDAPGTACVDLPAMVEWMQEHTLDPTELDFRFISPSPGYSPTHSYVTIQSAQSMNGDVIIESVRGEGEDTVYLTTTNVRSFEVDVDALRAKGITALVHNDDADYTLAEGGTLWIGPEDGKRAEVYGPFNQAFRKPYCYVYAEDAPVWADAAAFHTSYAQLIGHGTACGIPASRVTDSLRESHNLIYVGVDADDTGMPYGWSWDGPVEVEGDEYDEAILYAVFPRADGRRLDAVMTASEGDGSLLFRIPIWSSRGGLPDYFAWGPNTGTVAAGMIDADWDP